MSKTIIQNERRRKWFHTPKVKIPKVKKLVKNTNCVIHGLIVSTYSSSTGNNRLYSISNTGFIHEGGAKEKAPIGAGRGGKVYGQRLSNMGIIGEGAAKRTRARKKEITPYKPIPQMHTLHGLEDMRKGGI
jgi:hypothetical protein